jgi:hypothetical protein
LLISIFAAISRYDMPAARSSSTSFDITISEHGVRVTLANSTARLVDCDSRNFVQFSKSHALSPQRKHVAGTLATGEYVVKPQRRPFPRRSARQAA